MSAAMPGARSANPRTSSFGLTAAAGSLGRYLAARTSPATQNGTFTQNMNRQLRWVRMAPPTSGPRIGPSRAGSAIRVTVRPSALPPAACMISVVRTGKSRPPPTPWTTRHAISESTFQARLEPIDPTRNTASANIHSRLPPNRRSAQVDSGTAMPRASR